MDTQSRQDTWEFKLRAKERHRAALQAISDREDRSLNWLILRAIEEYAERMEQQEGAAS